MFPVIFESGKISIQTFWVFVVIALLCSSYIAVQRLKRRRVNLNLFIESSGQFLFVSVLLSRLAYFIFNYNTYLPRFDLRTIINFFSVWDQGFSFWGAALGFLIILNYKLIKEEEEIWKWYDALIVPLFIGIAIVNLGQFLGGNSYGIPTNLPWGIKYETINVLYTVPLHPVQFYSIFVVALLIWIKKKLSMKTKLFETPGNTALFLTSTGSFCFFLLDFLQGTDTLRLLGIRLTAIFFFILFVISTTVFIRRLKNTKHESPKTV